MIRRQPGFVLPLLLVLLATAVLTFLLMQVLGDSPQTQRDRQTTTALAQAKAAVLARVASRDLSRAQDLYGVLPCPDLGHGLNSVPEGSEQTNCGSAFVSSLGRLPRQSLKLGWLADGNNECLWYAVSGQHKSPQFKGSIAASAAADTIMLNEDTPALLRTVDHTNEVLTTDEQIVAVIFSAGAVLPGQNRTPSNEDDVALCGGNYAPANYLDNSVVSNVANSLSVFVQAQQSDTFNDRLVTLTRKEVFDAVARRDDFLVNMTAIARTAADCIRGSNPFPAPAYLNLGAQWDDYARLGNYTPAAGQVSGRLPAQWVKTNCPMSAQLDLLYAHWKDHFFYVLTPQFVGGVPQGVAPASLCSSNNCLTVNDGSIQYAAIVIFSGMRLTHQVRADATLGDIGQYLEVCNASNFVNVNAVANICSNPPNTPSNRNYRSAGVTSLFNDVLICVPADLSQSGACQ